MTRVSDHQGPWNQPRAIDINVPLQEAPSRVLFVEFAHWLRSIAPAFDHMHFDVGGALSQLQLPEEHHETPETPRDRALRLRQTRNTGPSRPAAQNAHRPRKAH